MNWRWGQFGDGQGIDLRFIPPTGRAFEVPEGPYLLTVDCGTVYLRTGDSIGPEDGTPLTRGTQLQVYVPTAETWSARSPSGVGRLTLTREAPID